jgi:hypothetical protein
MLALSPLAVRSSDLARLGTVGVMGVTGAVETEDFRAVRRAPRTRINLVSITLIGKLRLRPELPRTRLFRRRGLTLGSLYFPLPFLHDLLREVRDALVGMRSQLSDCETRLALLKKG